MVSTFGGGTATTEFEVLTGDSMAFLPYDCSAYQVFVKSETPGLISGLDSLGYQTAALHPYLATSWNRPHVYRASVLTPVLRDDFAADAARVRGYISDSADYRKIIELYEAKRADAPLFVFNVTMQNHGGYVGHRRVLRQAYPSHRRVGGQVPDGGSVPVARAVQR